MGRLQSLGPKKEEGARVKCLNDPAWFFLLANIMDLIMAGFWSSLGQCYGGPQCHREIKDQNVIALTKETIQRYISFHTLTSSALVHTKGPPKIFH